MASNTSLRALMSIVVTLNATLNAILNTLLLVKIRRLPEMVIEWGRTKKGKLTMIDLIGQNWR